MANSNHNFLRITRIIKFLKIMNMENYALLFFTELNNLYQNGYKRIIGNAATGNKKMNAFKELSKSYKIPTAGAIITGILLLINLIIRIIFKI